MLLSRSDLTRLASTALLSASALALCAAPAMASKFHVIYNFTGGADGGVPPFTLLPDGNGNLLGTANQGGKHNAGTLFSLSPGDGKTWQLSVLYDFTDKQGQPGWGLIPARHGRDFFVNTGYASVLGGPCGSVVKVKPSASSGEDRGHVVLTYTKSHDGCPTGNLLQDKHGNLFGVTQDGGANNWGSVFELTRGQGGYSETILYSFRGEEDGGAPYNALIEDHAGNLYGTATASTKNSGTVFELSPNGSGYDYKVLHAFMGGDDGGQPVAGLIRDGSGNLYGATESWGANGGGTVYELSPQRGSWSFQVLHALPGGSGGPVTSLTWGGLGQLYGTNFFDGTDSYGSVFSLTPENGKWRYRDLHDFTGGADGGYPGGGVVIDTAGDLFGTAVLGGTGNGVVYEITP
jgi:uncharacterized repeat protein (TIGR03803 family)